MKFDDVVGMVMWCLQRRIYNQVGMEWGEVLGNRRRVEEINR